MNQPQDSYTPEAQVEPAVSADGPATQSADMSSRDVKGFCPMGCGETLFLGSGGYVTCSWIECPAPDAASDILLTKETLHIVKLDEFDFSIQHPLRERLNGELFDCQLHTELNALSGPPRKPGCYRVGDGDGAGIRGWYAVGAS